MSAAYQVRLSALAVDDLVALHRWVAVRADRPTADAYLYRIEARVLALDTYPDRGTPRDDLVPGLRTLGFERRLVIAYRVAGHTVEILRIIDGARELGLMFGS